MLEENSKTKEEIELNKAIEAIIKSPSRKKLIVAGPGSGKTTLFKKILQLNPGLSNRRIVLTFINILKNDLERDLFGLAQVHTFHSFCLGLLHHYTLLGEGLSPDFIFFPGLAGLIVHDWEIINKTDSPKFVGEMRDLLKDNHINFYLARGNYYNAVDFDDSVYRAYAGLLAKKARIKKYDLVLIDEYQDFNRLEAEIINLLGNDNPIIIVGDDDQALYSQLRNSSWEHIRSLYQSGEYEVFNLPFCLRCPKVIVSAVGDILNKAISINKLQGRIDKPFKHFPPAKEADSIKYPKIVCIETSVQSKKINYIGRYIVQEISKIPENEVEDAIQGNYPVVLVIAMEPYRKQIIEFLEKNKIEVEKRDERDNDLNREKGISILKNNPDSNLGWRIVLDFDKPAFLYEIILATMDTGVPLIELIPKDYRDSILAEVDKFIPPDEQFDSNSKEQVTQEKRFPIVRVTSFEGSKGMSAQHVFIAGLHNKELPRNPDSIKDLEICKFLVGLTRTRKKCTLIYTKRFGIFKKIPSVFITWINQGRLDKLIVNKYYWDKGERKS
ncbi:MAG: ATP-dependent helicase [Ignavibacteria bacterium]|nr:ATP-dependent helicase [Ignavibacteria bacterium]